MSYIRSQVYFQLSHNQLGKRLHDAYFIREVFKRLNGFIFFEICELYLTKRTFF